jgi:FtsP/CotA-like multicopper oxidase with cupredoxin domain
MLSRRKFFTGVAAVAGGAAMTHGRQTLAADSPDLAQRADPPAAATGEKRLNQMPMPPGQPGSDYAPIETPNGATLPFKIVDGVKVFHLIAEEFDHEFCPGLKIKAWGYNGRTPGPTIEAVEGDRVRFYVTNRLPEPTSVHWHGVLVPNGMDGVSGLTQRGIDPGETMKYEFTLRQHGTQMYHPHFDEMTQAGMGMMGMFIIHPRKRPEPPIDRDFAIMLSEWRVDPGAARPNTTEMTEFNVLTFNSKAFPGTAPLVVKVGQRVRIRLGNLGPMDHHPIHLHGYRFRITETDGGQIPASAQQPETTVLTAVGSTRTFEFVADQPGDWAMHCHMTHHVMNQMGHNLPNLMGVDLGNLDDKVRKLLPGYMTMGTKGMGSMGEMGMKVPRNSISMLGAEGPFSYIDMGGMFTVLKVRDALANYEDPGWYEHPAGTVSVIASAEELKRDLGELPDAASPGTKPAPHYLRPTGF